MDQPALDLRHLVVVEAIHRTGSVTRAAKSLNLTQPAVSHALAQAERRLQVGLFHRRPRGLEPTAAGDRLARAARAILDQLRATEAELRPDDGEVSGQLRLTTECYTCYHWLPPVLAALARTFPKLQVTLVPESTKRPLEALLADEVDAAVLYSPVSHAGIETFPLFANEVVAAVAPGHRLAERPYLDASDFADEHVVLHFEPEHSVVFTDLLAPAGVTPQRITEARLTEGVIALAKAGLGIATLARWAIAPQLAAGELLAIPLTEQGIFRQWSAARRRSDGSRPASEELIRLLRTEGASLVAGPDRSTRR
ncbi:MAG TPA: LysR family transcriptional regulator [Thermoanaerobaculia bacterium]|nr:LysR family transcriptional regulator [Thermoanaerobaculia bacterium]